MTEQPQKPAKKAVSAVWIKPPTVTLLHQCKDQSPPDEFGRRLPLYAVVHAALELYLASLSKKQGRFTP